MLAIEWRRVSYIYLLHSDLASVRKVHAEKVHQQAGTWIGGSPCRSDIATEVTILRDFRTECVAGHS
jgi:hypothetical protein